MTITESVVETWAGTAGLTVKIVTTCADIEALRPAWQAFEQAPTDHGAPFFQSFAWCRHVARIRLERSPERYRLAVACVYDGVELVAVWPLSLQKRAGIWMLRNLDDPFGQFAGVLCRRAEWIEPSVKAVMDHVRTSRLADAVCIDSVLAGTPLHAALRAAGTRMGTTNEVVQVDMRGCATFADYQKTLNTKTRKNLRNAMNRLLRLGDVENAVLTDQKTLSPMIRHTFDGRLAWMRLKGKSTDAFRDADFRPVIEGVTEAEGLDPIGFELRSRGEVLASQWGFEFAGRYYAYISAREQGHDQFSPGRLHLGCIIEACKTRGLHVLELMAPASRYKLMWSDRVTAVQNLWIPLSLRGRVMLGVLEVAMPAARGLVRKLPTGLKSRLAEKVNSQ